MDRMPSMFHRDFFFGLSVTSSMRHNGRHCVPLRVEHAFETLRANPCPTKSLDFQTLGADSRRLSNLESQFWDLHLLKAQKG
ncbi:hypothetical protein [Pandoraea captiosa]|uniref:hypothetical protein n=1 Tax=Pandoraea captiosa TaxID=2508302 RepID=UPI00124226F4|nr:hypothetical protein [Pandoraea captiosa]